MQNLPDLTTISLHEVLEEIEHYEAACQGWAQIAREFKYSPSGMQALTKQLRCEEHLAALYTLETQLQYLYSLQNEIHSVIQEIDEKEYMIEGVLAALMVSAAHGQRPEANLSTLARELTELQDYLVLLQDELYEEGVLAALIGVQQINAA